MESGSSEADAYQFSAESLVVVDERNETVESYADPHRHIEHG